jgi:hypothetical protein
MREHHDLPLIGAIAAAIRWVEELVSLLSGPLLSVGLAIALIDLLTGGGLLHAVPDLLFAWGICQAVGIDAQLVATWDRCRVAMRKGAWVQVIALAVLGVALGYVGFLSAEAFGFQQAFGLSEVDALQQLGIDAASWQLQRALLAVFLVALSGFTRYHPQRKTVADERAALERELELEPLRQEARALKAVGAAGLARQALAAVRGTPLDDKPPTGGGSPIQAEATPSPSRDASEAIEPRQLRPVPTQPRQAAANGRSNGRRRRRVRTAGRPASAEAAVRAVWRPDMSVGQLAEAAKIGRSTASKWKRLMEREAAQQVAQ